MAGVSCRKRAVCQARCGIADTYRLSAASITRLAGAGGDLSGVLSLADLNLERGVSQTDQLFLPVSDRQAFKLRSQPSDGRMTKLCIKDPTALPMQHLRCRAPAAVLCTSADP